MNHRTKYTLWIFPILGIILGIIYAFTFIHGVLVPWHCVGKPSENISRIIGFVGGQKFFVETETGEMYSIEYYNYQNGNDFLPMPIQWNKEEIGNIVPDPIRKPIMKYISLPVFFKVEQQYEMQFPLIEGEWYVKFALANDGNLWMWNYGQAAFASLTYFAFPIVGLFFGSILAILIRIGIFLREKLV